MKNNNPPNALVANFSKLQQSFTLEPQSLEVATLHNDLPISGYGTCSVSGCYCSGYMGSGSICENCGHNYSFHY